MRKGMVSFVLFATLLGLGVNASLAGTQPFNLRKVATPDNSIPGRSGISTSFRPPVVKGENEALFGSVPRREGFYLDSNYPTYKWHTFYGSYTGGTFLGDAGSGIAVDGNGDVYITGGSYLTWQGDGDASPIHTFTRGLNNKIPKINAFVLKLDSNGRYQWHTFYGSVKGSVGGDSISVDETGNIYVTGRSQATWQGDDGANPLHPHSGEDDIFVLKLNSDGQYQWHTFYGSEAQDYGSSIAADETGNVYVTGYSQTTWQGDGGANPLHPHSGDGDIVIFKLDSNGRYQWHTFYGSGKGPAGGHSISVDETGNVYVTGLSLATWQGDGGANPLHPHSGDGDTFGDIVILKLDTEGQYHWHTFYGSEAQGDSGYGIAADRSGNVYVTGGSQATWQGDGGANPLHPHSGDRDIVILRLDTEGQYQWHTFYGSDRWDESYGIVADDSNNVYLTGMSRATWDGDGGAEPVHPFSGRDDIAVLKLNGDGQYQWHAFYGSGDVSSSFGVDSGYGISVDGTGNVYVTGESHVPWNSPPLHAHSGSRAIFVLKLSQAMEAPEIVTVPATPNGPTSGIIGTSYVFTVDGSLSTLGHAVQYCLWWGDGTNSGWLPAGTTSASKTWISPEAYPIRAKARCSVDTDVESDWSGALNVTIESAPLPDLTGQWISLTQTCRSVKNGTKCKISGKLNIQNIGNLNAPSSFVRFYLSDDGDYDEGLDIFLKQVATGTIKAGKNKTKTLSRSFFLSEDTISRN